jgi:hypothetical protein
LRFKAAFLQRLAALRVTGYGFWVGDTAGGLPFREAPALAGWAAGLKSGGIITP